MSSPTDSFTPWLEAEDLELLQNFDEPLSQPTAQSHKTSRQPEVHSPDWGGGDDLYSGEDLYSLPYPPPAAFSDSLASLTKPQLELSPAKPASATAAASPASPMSSSTTSNDARVGSAGAASTLVSVERAREKNREKVKRHYYRKRNLLATLRGEVAMLERQFEQLDEAKYSGKLTLAVVASGPSRQLARLQEAKLQLETENEQLRRLHSQTQSHFSQIASLLASEYDLFFTSQLAKAHFIKPFTRQEYFEESSRAVAGVIALSTPNPMAQSFRGPSFLGWENEVSAVGGFFNFSLFKTFPNISPHKLASITWPMASDPVAVARMFSPAVKVKTVVVQEVDEDNVVLFQEYGALDAHNENVLMKSLFLVTRSKTATGELFVLRGLGEDRLQDRELFLPSREADAGQVVWHDIFVWYKFDRAGMFGEDCNGSFGGVAPTVGANSQAWSLEILSLVVRWESAIFGPPQLLPVSTDNEPHASPSDSVP